MVMKLKSRKMQLTFEINRESIIALMNQPVQQMKMMLMKLQTAIHHEHNPQKASFFPRICGTAISMTRWLLAILTTLYSSFQVRLLCQCPITRLQHRLFFLNIKWRTGFKPGFATSHTVWRLGQAKGSLLLSLNQRPVNATVKANITRRNSVFKIVKKGEVQSPNLIMLPGIRSKKICHNMSCTPIVKTQHFPEWNECR